MNIEHLLAVLGTWTVVILTACGVYVVSNLIGYALWRRILSLANTIDRHAAVVEWTKNHPERAARTCKRQDRIDRIDGE
ncbi:MAG: hypothetical protein LBC97_15850 [Bifidobacteriaceae bacterium]|jgi:hypothetical protein|nr:hypothetical protein [Bifidobacteriaceae bacterium]